MFGHFLSESYNRFWNFQWNHRRHISLEHFVDASVRIGNRILREQLRRLSDGKCDGTSNQSCWWSSCWKINGKIWFFLRAYPISDLSEKKKLPMESMIDGTQIPHEHIVDNMFSLMIFIGIVIINVSFFLTPMKYSTSFF